MKQKYKPRTISNTNTKPNPKWNTTPNQNPKPNQNTYMNPNNTPKTLSGFPRTQTPLRGKFLMALFIETHQVLMTYSGIQ